MATSIDKTAAFMTKLLEPVDVGDRAFLRDVAKAENQAFHRLWVKAMSAAHLYQSCHWAWLHATFYDRANKAETSQAQDEAKAVATAAVSALMACPAMTHDDIAHKRQAYRLCGHGGKNFMPDWDEALAADMARLSKGGH